MYVGEGSGNPLQYSSLENLVDRGAWWAAVHSVAQSQTWLKQLCMHACIGEGNGNPLQYSCLENPRDRGAWWAAICGVTQSRTRLKRLSSSSSRLHLAVWHGGTLFRIRCLPPFPTFSMTRPEGFLLDISEDKLCVYHHKWILLSILICGILSSLLLSRL